MGRVAKVVDAVVDALLSTKDRLSRRHQRTRKRLLRDELRVGGLATEMR